MIDDHNEKPPVNPILTPPGIGRGAELEKIFDIYLGKARTRDEVEALANEEARRQEEIKKEKQQMDHIQDQMEEAQYFTYIETSQFLIARKDSYDAKFPGIVASSSEFPSGQIIFIPEQKSESTTWKINNDRIPTLYREKDGYRIHPRELVDIQSGEKFYVTNESGQNVMEIQVFMVGKKLVYGIKEN